MAVKRKGKTWRLDNPLDVFKRIVAENPKAGKRKLSALCVKEIRRQCPTPDLLISWVDYLISHNYEKLRGGQP